MRYQKLNRFSDSEFKRLVGVSIWTSICNSTDESQLDLRRGVIIQSDVSTEHVHFW